MIRNVLAYILANAVGLYVVSLILSGVQIGGSWTIFALAGAVMGLVNMFVKPIIKLLSLPFIFLSMGLFLVVINALMLWLTEKLVVAVMVRPEVREAVSARPEVAGVMDGSYFYIGHWGDYVLAAVILSIVNMFMRWFLKLK